MCSCKTSCIHISRTRCCRFILCKWIFKKRLPMYHTSSMYQNTSKNRGKAFHEDSEQLQEDWERGITQSCLPSRDYGNPWIRSKNDFPVILLSSLTVSTANLFQVFHFLESSDTCFFEGSFSIVQFCMDHTSSLWDMIT